MSNQADVDSGERLVTAKLRAVHHEQLMEIARQRGTRLQYLVDLAVRRLLEQVEESGDLPVDPIELKGGAAR